MVGSLLLSSIPPLILLQFTEKYLSICEFQEKLIETFDFDKLLKKLKWNNSFDSLRYIYTSRNLLIVKTIPTSVIFESFHFWVIISQIFEQTAKCFRFLITLEKKH